MDVIVDLAWRVYPAGLLIALGMLALAGGIGRITRSIRRLHRGRRAPVLYVSGLRLSFVGLAAAGVGGAWITQQDWLLAIALLVGGQEIFETSRAMRALRASAS